MTEEKAELSVKRILWIDLAKVIAIVLVVLIHSIELNFIKEGSQWIYVSTLNKLIVVILFSLGRLSVPIFLFISGYLFLGKSYNTTEDVIRHYKKYLITTIIEAEIWIVIYFIFNITIQDIPISIKDMIKQLTFFELPSIMSFWYIPVLISLYIVYPFLANILKVFDMKVLKIPLTIAIINYFIIPTYNQLASFVGWSQLGVSSITSYLFSGLYITYAVLGYMLFRKRIVFMRLDRAMILLAVTFLLFVVFQSYGWKYGSGSWPWYDSIFILVCSIAVIYCIIGLSEKYSTIIERICTNRIVKAISENTLSIFYCHVLFQILLKRNIFKSDSMKNIILVFIFSFLLSYFFSIGVKKIKNHSSK